MEKTRRKNSWRWINQFPETIKDILNDKHLENPLHVEIHPHHASTIMCNNNCHSCTGSIYRNKPNYGIDPNRLIETIDSFKGRVKEIIFSGNCIEPLLYPDIKEVIRHIRKADIGFSLYSNFYYADRPGLMEELLNTEKEDYVRASINAGTEESYNLVHRPIYPNTFNRVLNNISKFLELKRKSKADIFLHVTYLMTNENSNKNELESIIKWSEDHGVDAIRFSTYQKPLWKSMPDKSAIPEEKLKKIRNNLKDLKEKYTGLEVQITQEPLLLKEKEKPFKKCYIQEPFPVIDYGGWVCACTSVAYPCNPKIFKFGNINQENFWDIWKNKEDKINFSIEGCPDCTRAEYHINCEFQKLKDMHSKK